ncbi:MAG: dephospho-CoA kinase, partial [Bacilli bacterium]|nr:dephospho-CoA kinase [Bacilli bacterium]
NKGGYCTISSDEIVHELYTQKEVQDLINKRLKVKGEKSFIENLREHLATHPADLERLEKIVHPLVKKEIEKTFKASKSPLLVAEVPLLFKAKMQDMFDVIIGIDIDEKIQLERLKIRDQEKSAFLKRINDENNLFDEHRLDLDFIVINNDTVASLRKDTKAIIDKLLSRLNPLLHRTSI